MIELSWLKAAGVKDGAKWLPYIEQTCGQFKINTPARIACFLAQTAHESAGYTMLEENLNYSAKGLTETFRKYFRTIEEAKPFARKPEAIANKVYGGRMGNVNEGDGWKFRGRGLLQFTGRKAYEGLGFAFGLDFIGNPDLLLQPHYAAMSAGYFWQIGNLNIYADSQMFKSVTQRINGGLNGWEDRVKRWNAVKEAMHIS